MTARLYYRDSYLTEFHAAVTDAGECRVVLNETAFYPTSGGQPYDTGTINGVPVVDVIDEGERIVHVTQGPVAAGEALCSVDWQRRFDHMQQHTGQHLLSAVLADLFHAETVSFHLGAESSSIDVTAQLSEKQLAAAETGANEVVFQNRVVSVSFEDARQAAGLRKPSEREGEIRIVTIDGLDRSACGGTHVRSTGEIGPILLRKTDRVHGATRIEFLCGMRAVRRARADFDALTRISRTLSTAPDETPALVAAQVEALEASEKSRRKLAGELALRRGRDLYEATAPAGSGVRYAVHQVWKGALDDEVRMLAQGFTAGERGCFLAIADEPAAVLLAASKDAGVHAGNIVKQAVTAAGGRGGGNPQLAQGSVPSGSALGEVVAAIQRAIGMPV